MISIHWLCANASNSFICWLSFWKIMRRCHHCAISWEKKKHEKWKCTRTVEFHQVSESSDVLIEFRWRHCWASEGNHSRYMHTFSLMKTVTVMLAYSYQSTASYDELFSILQFVRCEFYSVHKVFAISQWNFNLFYCRNFVCNQLTRRFYWMIL